MICGPIFLCFVVFVTKISSAREFTDAEYSLLPNLYELDDYKECLKRKDGVYCLGTFELGPTKQPDPTYNLIKEYSQQTNAYNRTILHRGYCISERCPIKSLVDNTSNAALRFGVCVADWAHARALRATPKNIHYCHSYEDYYAPLVLDIPMFVFLVVFCTVSLTNIFGTSYDLIKGNNPKKNKLIISFSLKKNFNDFITSPYAGRNQSLTALHGIRVTLATCICFVHTGIVYYRLYLYNPRYVEQMTLLPVTMFVQNGTSMVQMFVVLSSFFCAYNVKKATRTNMPSYTLFLKLILKRILRFCPVYLCLILFAASWWPSMRSGPLWSYLVGSESQICREKFWTHAIFLNNLIQPNRICLLPTWYIAVDIQLYIVALLLTLAMSRLQSGVLPILSVLLVFSIGLNAVLAYIYHWPPMVYFASVTENIREAFINVPSFPNLHMSPWGNLPSCIIGLLMGHLYKTKADTWTKLQKYKWALYIISALSSLILVGWILLGLYIKSIENRILIAFFAATERSLSPIVYLFPYVILCVLNSGILNVFSWRVWHPLSRMSLSVILIHWCVILFVLGPNPQLFYVDFFSMLVNAVAIVCFTYIVSLPTTLCLEMPMKSLFDQMLS